MSNEYDSSSSEDRLVIVTDEENEPDDVTDTGVGQASNTGVGQACNIGVGRPSDISVGPASNIGVRRPSDTSVGPASNIGVGQASNIGVVRAFNTGVGQAPNTSVSQASNIGAGRPSNTGVGQASNTGVGQASNIGVVQAFNTGVGQASNTGVGQASNIGVGWASNTGVGWASNTGIGQASNTGVGQAFNTRVGQQTNVIRLVGPPVVLDAAVGQVSNTGVSNTGVRQAFNVVMLARPPVEQSGGTVGQVSNVVMPVRRTENIIVRAGPSWDSASPRPIFVMEKVARENQLAREQAEDRTAAELLLLAAELARQGSELERQTTPRASQVASRGGARTSGRHTPYPNRDTRRTQATTANPTYNYPTLTYPTLSYSTHNYPTLSYPTLAATTMAMPPHQPFIQNPAPSQYSELHTIRQILNPNYTPTARPQITVRSASQLFAPRPSPQLTPRSAPMVFIRNPSPHFVPIALEPRTSSSTSVAPWLERQLSKLTPKPQVSPVSVRHADPVHSICSTPNITHTVTATTSDFVFTPSTLLPVLHTHEESNQPDPRTNLLNQPTHRRPRTPGETIMEHQQCQYWPLDTSIDSDVVEENVSSECDSWLNIESIDSSDIILTPVTSPSLTTTVSLHLPPPTTTIITHTATSTTATTTTSSSEDYPAQPQSEEWNT